MSGRDAAPRASPHEEHDDRFARAVAGFAAAYADLDEHASAAFGAAVEAGVLVTPASSEIVTTTR